MKRSGRRLTVRSEDPWAGIAKPPSDQTFSGRLAPECRPYDLFRGLDHLGRRVLFLVHDKRSASKAKLPEMAGLIVEKRERPDEDKLLASVILESEEDADIFARLSEDIIEVVAGADNERAAVTSFIERTWKWHALLRGKRKSVLGRDAQMGLMGELWTLLHVLAPHVGIDTAVAGWKGAENAPKDFEMAGACIECKSRGAASRSKVRISSEHQLEDVSGHRLALLVHTFAVCAEDQPAALSLHDLVARLRSEVASDAPQSMHLLERGLEVAGYDARHEYDLAALLRTTDVFEVTDSFPRIVPGSVPSGPVEIRYDLPLHRLEPFRIDMQVLADILTSKGDRDARDR